MVRSNRVGFAFLFAIALMVTSARPGRAQTVTTFVSSTPIAINDATTATPYPSRIDVQGLTGVVVKVRVTVRLTHSSPSDLGIWLTGPALATPQIALFARLENFGTEVISAANDVTLQFDDCATRLAVPPGALISGRYRPGGIRGAVFQENGGQPLWLGDRRLVPQTQLAAFNGPANRGNGLWSLWVSDHVTGGIGTIAGWSLTVYTRPTSAPAPGLGFVGVGCAKPDYDGDGLSDVAVYRPATGEWFVLNSSTNTGTVTSWGAPALTGAGDIAAPGDYDGDGVTDIAVYRQTTGTWFMRYSFGGSEAINWGAPSALGLADTPVPGDYDNDGITDNAVYRASTGEWIIRNSNASGMTVRTWGAPGLGDYPARR